MQNDLKKQAAAVTAASGGGVAAPAGGAGDELDRLYAAVAGRKAFSYDASSDPVYGMLRDSYVSAGRTAMRDTMGRAAALTGGYGSSYAQSAGQQQYDSYLRSLSELMPQLYSAAYERYEGEGRRMRELYDMALGREKEEYSRRKDDYERAAAETKRAAEAEEREYRRGRDAAADAASAEKLSYERAQAAYTKLVKLISSSGYSPTDEELTASGLSRAQADALLAQYRLENGVYDGAAQSGAGGGKKKNSLPKTVFLDSRAPVGKNIDALLDVYYPKGGAKK